MKTPDAAVTPPKRKLRGWKLVSRIVISLALVLVIVSLAVPDLFLYAVAIYWPL